MTKPEPSHSHQHLAHPSLLSTLPSSPCIRIRRPSWEQQWFIDCDQREHTGCLPTSGRVRELRDLTLQRQGRAPQKEAKQKQRSKKRKKNYQRGWKGEKARNQVMPKSRICSVQVLFSLRYNLAVPVTLGSLLQYCVPRSSYTATQDRKICVQTWFFSPLFLWLIH